MLLFLWGAIISKFHCILSGERGNKAVVCGLTNKTYHKLEPCEVNSPNYHSWGDLRRKCADDRSSQVESSPSGISHFPEPDVK